MSTQGDTPTDFITALDAGGSSLSFVGVSDFSPQNWFFRGLYLLNSLIGLTLASLITSYLLQLYENLRERNTLGLKVNIVRCGVPEVVLREGAEGGWGLV